MARRALMSVRTQWLRTNAPVAGSCLARPARDHGHRLAIMAAQMQLDLSDLIAVKGLEDGAEILTCLIGERQTLNEIHDHGWSVIPIHRLTRPQRIGQTREAGDIQILGTQSGVDAQGAQEIHLDQPG